MTPASRSATSGATTPAIVAASSRAGTQTDIDSVRCARRRSAGNSAWWKLRHAKGARTMAAACPSHPHVQPWSALLDAGRADERLVREAFEGAREPVPAPLPDELHPALRRRAARGRDRGAVGPPGRGAAAPRGTGPTIVTTGTASGKSLCFNLPTLDVLCRDAKARALYLYPTKALAQDQARAINAFGLTSRCARRSTTATRRASSAAQIRRRANLVLTNPDMLHVGILPHHRRGATSSPTSRSSSSTRRTSTAACSARTSANVLRRLRRIANAYGTEPRFLLASATIANPVELAERLTGLEEIALVDRDGAPGARREIAMWNPPLIDEALGTRALVARRGGRDRRRAGAARARGRSASSSRARRSSWSRGWSASAEPGAAPTASRPTAPATRRSSAASWRAG